MVLTWIVFFLLLGGVLAWIAGRWSDLWPRWISLAALTLHLAWLHRPLGGLPAQLDHPELGPWMWAVHWDWIPSLGIHYSMAMDGLSLVLCLLANFLGFVGVLASWKTVQARVGFFHFNLLWVLTAVIGLFVAMDLILFYLFWELMLIPLYLLIGIWGHENRVYATIKFFLYTQASSLPMLLAILALYQFHGRATGVYTFEYSQLLGTPLPYAAGYWLMLGFFVAFAVKLPMVPLHTWLPDAHTEAPTAGSVDLAGLVLKVGAYGFLRILIPLFPRQAMDFAPVPMALGVAGILYAALVALKQTDLKRLIAYTSVSHMGFVLLGIFAWNQLALLGAVMIMIAHGISTAALFVLVGDLDDRTHTRDLRRMSGLAGTVPKISAAWVFFGLASMGLPGLANFVGELLVFLGTFPAHRTLAVLAALGVILSAVYSLYVIRVVFYGPNTRPWKIPDMTSREAVLMSSMIGVNVWLGVYPNPVLRAVDPAVRALQQSAAEPPAERQPATGSSFGR